MAEILAIMQNQWFHNPASARRALSLAEAKGQRHRLIKYALFAGCKSGKVLRQVFGDRCDTIHWEEASKEVGDRASSAFAADLDHLKGLLALKPWTAVLCFGRIAGDAMQIIAPRELLIVGPHPAARGPNVMLQLNQMRELLDARHD